MNTEPGNVGADVEVDDSDIVDDAVIGRATFWSFVVFGVAGVVGLIVWATLRQPVVTSGEEAPLVPVSDRPAPPRELPRIPFTDITAEAGIDFVHESGARGAKLLPETMGGGVAFLDFDGDRDPDLLFVNGRPWGGDEPRPGVPTFPGLVLYENDGTGRFTNVTERVGLDGVSVVGMGVAAGDHDGDGRIDLFVSAVGANVMLRNTGERFVDVTETTGLAGAPDDWSTSCGWFDFDRDGDLDLFVCNYLDWSSEDDASRDFTLRGGGRAYGRPANFGGAHCRLYENDGEGRFTDVSERAGILVANPDTGVPMGKSLGLAFTDFDDDGWLDVFVANDTVRNFLFHNRGDGTFDEVASLHGIAFDSEGMARGGMGVDVSTFRDDGAIGVAIGNFSNETTALYVSPPGEMQFDDQANANGLSTVTRLDLTFGTLFVDADLDGRPDLFSVNGHLEEDIALVQSSQSYEQPPRLLWNAGAKADVEFESLPESSVGPDLVKPCVGRGAATADIDADGDPDLVIATCSGPPRLLRNDVDNGHHWLRVVLDAPIVVGTTVDVTTPDGRTTRHRVGPTRSYLSQSDTTLVIGLGENDRIDELNVRWPDGAEVSQGTFDSNQTIQIRREPGE